MSDGLEELRAICLALQEAVENAENEMARPTFRLRDKIFAWYMDNHHGDGRVGVWCKAPPGVQQMLVAADPERFYVPPYVGPRGWIGVRLDVESVDWDEVSEIVVESYRMTAPKKLAKEASV
jgi:hypothetical protein